MTKIFCMLLIASSYSSFVYPIMAKSGGWVISKFLDKNVFFVMFNFMVLIGAFIEGFYMYKWYIAILIFFLSAFIGYIITSKIKSDALYLAPVVTIVCLLALAALNAQFIRP